MATEPLVQTGDPRSPTSLHEARTRAFDRWIDQLLNADEGQPGGARTEGNDDAPHPDTAHAGAAQPTPLTEVKEGYQRAA